MKKTLFILAVIVSSYSEGICQTFSTPSNGTFNTSIVVEEQKINRGFRMFLGPKLTYYKGTGPQSLGPYDKDRVNFQADAIVGYLFNPERTERGNFLGVFGSAGMSNGETMRMIFKDQDFPSQIVDAGKQNVYYQAEVGMYVMEFLRISSGVGRQQFSVVSNATLYKAGNNGNGNNGNGNGNNGNGNGNNGNNGTVEGSTTSTIENPKTFYTLQYYSSTVGIKVNFGPVDLVFDVNWWYGGNLNNLVARPSTGIYVKF